MKTNVTYLEQTPYVNNEKQTVVVRLVSEIDLNKIPGMQAFINLPEVLDVLEQYPWFVDEDDNLDCGVIGFETIGKSKAIGGDVFDSDLGQKVASTRAQEKAFAFATRFYCDLCGAIYSVANQIDDLALNSDMCVVNCEEHVYDLLGDKLPAPETTEE